MSEEQLSALLAKLKEDEGLRETLQGVADLEAAVVIAMEAGFDVSKADWLRHQAKQTLELSDEELEVVAGGEKTERAGSCKGECTKGVYCRY
jgi:predicted ribosomally synthesized peptide with nif11-like leader